MNNNDLVSIIVLSYNNLQYMKDCLSSILVQTYPYIEIIISDDFSDDFSMDEIKIYIESNRKNNLINYVINQNCCNLGTVKNINNAIRLATGNYFVHIACDDIFFDNQAISNIVDFYSKTNYLIAAGQIARYDESLNSFLFTLPLQQYVKYIYGNPIDCYKKLCDGDFIPSPGMSYKRELLNRYGMYDEEYMLIEDYPRWLYLTRNGCSIGYIEKLLVKYRSGGMSTSDKDSNIKRIFLNDLELVKKKEIVPYIDQIKYIIYK
ncbi:glycosyltransferase [Clostridium chromiireducens]|uniref:Glycosyltransferase n=1 Tax=Clostridium chromiireducens TaxID=225345 RepID=A0A964RNU9_9CLOT|nr:glycosyltransferase [Clostridium chromiireducens]MVX65097.1 glycosyltransferase [Clostridium chromiireducens]